MTRYAYMPDGTPLFESGFVSTTSTETTVFFKGVAIGEFEITTQYKCSYCGRLSEINQTKTLCEGCGAPLERENS